MSTPGTALIPKKSAGGLLRRGATAVIGRAGLYVGDVPAVGQTEKEIEAIYGEAVRRDMLKGREYIAWERKGFVLLVAMEDGRSICLHFTRPAGILYPKEICALLDGSANGWQWTPFGTGCQKWRREDGGALAMYGDGSLFIYLSGPGVRLVAENMRGE